MPVSHIGFISPWSSLNKPIFKADWSHWRPNAHTDARMTEDVRHSGRKITSEEQNQVETRDRHLRRHFVDSPLKCSRIFHAWLQLLLVLALVCSNVALILGSQTQLVTLVWVLDQNSSQISLVDSLVWVVELAGCVIGMGYCDSQLSHWSGTQG